MLLTGFHTTNGFQSTSHVNKVQHRRNEWVHNSMAFYSTITREEKRRERNQIVSPSPSDEDELDSTVTAKILYFARHKIKNGKLNHAERIYRKHISDLLQNEDPCDHTQLATSVLLLTLLLQRKEDHVDETREAFLSFFRVVAEESLLEVDIEDGEILSMDMKECTCSAKVIQAFALFEMKQGNVKRSYSLARMAVKMDEELEPILRWKQFREAKLL